MPRPPRPPAAPRPQSAELPVVSLATAAHWDAWLARHHASSRGVWLKIAKKGSGTASLDYAQALEVALTWGWIDGQKRAHDATAWLQRFGPRGARSLWSRINRDKVLALTAAGRMHPPGLAEVERARADGRWDAAYEGAARTTVPEDLAAALAAQPRAAAAFASLDAANRYAILFRVHTAKRAETRARRVADLVAMLARGETLHPRGRRAPTSRA